jgi:glutamine amidotransferase-like uncharacterized protein
MLFKKSVIKTGSVVSRLSLSWAALSLSAACFSFNMASLSLTSSAQAADAPAPASSPATTGAAPTGITGATPPVAGGFTTDFLIYDGSGGSVDDAQSMANIIQSHGHTYKFANEADLNSMTEDELATYGVIMIPGGYGGMMTDAIPADARERIRKAVTERGVSYMGTCAGSFMAQGPEAMDKNPSYGFAFIPGKVMDYWYPKGDSNAEAAMVDVTTSDGAKHHVLWYGGPAIPSLPNGVVGKYDNGVPAIGESWAGKGMVVLSAIHPEAPEVWLSEFATPADHADTELAWQLYNSALTRQPIQAFKS